MRRAREKGFTVALVGADGAGKSTISQSLPDVLPFPVKSIYMGVNLHSGGHMLPTTRLLLAAKRARGRTPDMPVGATQAPREATAPARARAGLKAATRLAVWISEEMFRQLLAWYFSRLRGYVVVFDRDFFADFYVHDVAARDLQRPLTRRIHGFFLQHVYPKPDLVLCLDAPGPVLVARKDEAPVEWLEARRLEYLLLERVVQSFIRIDATRQLADVTRDVVSAIVEFHNKRAGRKAGPEGWIAA
jgi:thymidylate kinase